MARSVANAADTERYETDFHLWAQRQAELLRQRRFGDLDLENLIEEVDDLARREWKAVRSHARRAIEHLLKLQFSPAASPRGGWLNTVITQRAELEDGLSPSLRRDLAVTLGNLYRRARDAAAADMRQDRVALEQLPETCPYTIDQILDFGWLPENVHGLRDDPPASQSPTQPCS